ncbi:MAG: ABC transporter permease [Anaerolineae bacterium]|nr:ABC transporter permease [Anaerolineae bacterium]
MKNLHLLYHILKADFLERTRRYSFLIVLGLTLYLGYAVNSGQVLIQLQHYRGIYNSAWVGSLMSLVITFFLGIFGFYLVKNSIQRDETSGVGQIIATTSISRGQYLLGKWLSNFVLLSTLVFILALAALGMQLLHAESAALFDIWALIAPFLFVALPMMALVAAFAIFFECISWLKGGFGNMMYFFVFIFIIVFAIELQNTTWMDVTGIRLIGDSMKAAALAVFPDYNGSFVLGMTEREALKTFVWNGVNWTLPTILSRLIWLPVSLLLVLLGLPFFNRFDPHHKREKAASPTPPENETSNPLPVDVSPHSLQNARLSPLPQSNRFHFNGLRLTWLNILLLVKGLKWYWWLVMLAFWIGALVSPGEGYRKYFYMMLVVWPVLVWSKMGQRDALFQTEQLVFQAAYFWRVLLSEWLAGLLFTAAATSSVWVGRFISGESLQLTAWLLAVFFIPTLAFGLGCLSRSNKPFEVIYPILWYLGPFNAQNQLSILDYLGIHAASPAYIAPLLFAGCILVFWVLTLLFRSKVV